MNTKTSNESQDRTTAAPVVAEQPALPEKASGPQHAASTASASAAPPPPNGAPPAMRGAAVLGQPGISTVARAGIVKSLQRTVGNNRVSNLLRRTIQTKLTVGAVDDPHEREADRFAQTITQGGNQANSSVSRKFVMRHPLAESLQRAALPEADHEGVDAGMEQRITSPGGGRPLPRDLQGEMETGLNTDFSQVRVHDNAQDQADAAHLGAKAFTHGSDIWLGAGQSVADRQLMAHELTHVVQQNGADVARIPASNPERDDTAAVTQNNSQVQPEELTGGPEATLLPEHEQPNEVTSSTSLDASVTSGQQPTASTTSSLAETSENLPTTSEGPTETSQSAVTTNEPSTSAVNAPSVGSAPGDVGTATDTTSPVSQTSTTPLNGGGAGPRLPAATGETTEQFHRFLDAALAQRVAMLRSADAKKTDIRTNAEAQKLNLQLAINAEAGRIDGIYEQSIQQIRSAMRNARTEVESQRTARIRLAQQTAETELANLERVITEKQTAVRRVGGLKATEAERVGEEQAQRATTGSLAKAVEARAIGNRKAQQYSTYNRARRIARVAREMATETAQKVFSDGVEMASVARRDASELAAKFRREANEAAEHFAESRTPAMTKIQRERDATINGLSQIGTEPLTDLESQGANLIAQLETGRSGVAVQIRQRLQGATTQIDRSAQSACNGIDQQVQQEVSELDQFISDMQARFGSASSRTAERRLDEALVEVTNAVSEFDGQLIRAGNSVSQAIEQESVQMIQQVRTQADQLSPPVQRSGAEFEAGATRASGQIIQSMEEPTTNGVNEMQRAVTDVERELQNGINESETSWDRELSQGTTEIRDKISQGLDKQNEIVAALPSKIDEKAEEIEHESLLSRALSFVGGFIVGFLQGVWGLVKVLLIAALIIIAIIVVVAAIILLVGGIAALFEAILAVAAFIGAIAAVLGVIVKVIGVLLIIYFVLKGASLIYLAITRDDLSDYERGKLAGHGTFDIVISLFGGWILSRLGRWFRGLRGARRVEGGEGGGGEIGEGEGEGLESEQGEGQGESEGGEGQEGQGESETQGGEGQEGQGESETQGGEGQEGGEGESEAQGREGEQQGRESESQSGEQGTQPAPLTRPLRKPAVRHYAWRVKQGTVPKAKNTVFDRSVDVAADVEAINSGRAVRVGETYIVNGRTYGYHPDGRVFPISGPGLHPLSRGAFQALGVYNKFGDTARATEILDNMGTLREARIAALEVWRILQNQR